MDAIVGFWSYAHDDNRLDNGAILKLARSISEEFELLSGEPLTLFVDREDISWGEAWRERINEALTETTFFIPIITPRYFTRPECRRELLEFAAKARNIGTDELLLPILYVKPLDFSPDSLDEAVSLVAKTQYENWQDLRLIEPESREFKRSVNVLARRLLEIAARVSEDQLRREVHMDQDAISEGITELVERINGLLPDWLDAVIGDRINRIQVDVTWHKCATDISKLRRSHAPASAVNAAVFRAGREMLPLIERHQRDAHTYLSRSVQLDPDISSLARILSEHPESFDLIESIRQAIDEAVANITGKKGSMESHAVDVHFSEWAHLGKIFKKCAAISNDTYRTVKEGNEIVARWDAELRRSTSEGYLFSAFSGRGNH
jgi:hypothetical protein